MGDYRHQADQSLPPRYGNSPGADYFGGVSQIHAAKGSRPDLYGTVLPNGDRVYNLDAQVAAHYTIHQQLADPEVPRTTGANSHADTIAQRHDIECWYPDHPANQAGAMAHGRLRLGYADAQGHHVEKVLDLDQGRRFSTTTRDPATGQALSIETKTPTGPLVAQNYFTPSYAVETRDGQGKLLAQSTLPEGKNDHPRVDGSPMYREALRDLKMKYREIQNDPDEIRRAVPIEVEKDIKAQRNQASQHYLAKDHPLHREVVSHPYDTPTKQEQPQASGPTVERRPTVSSKAAPDVPQAASIAPERSVNERFKALVDAIERKDDKAYDQVIQGHQASPEWQKLQQQSHDYEQALIAQQQREREQQLAAQRGGDVRQQQQQGGPAMGR